MRIQRFEPAAPSRARLRGPLASTQAKQAATAKVAGSLRAALLPAALQAVLLRAVLRVSGPPPRALAAVTQQTPQAPVAVPAVVTQSPIPESLETLESVTVRKEPAPPPLRERGRVSPPATQRCPKHSSDPAGCDSRQALHRSESKTTPALQATPYPSRCNHRSCRAGCANPGQRGRIRKDRRPLQPRRIQSAGQPISPKRHPEPSLLRRERPAALLRQAALSGKMVEQPLAISVRSAPRPAPGRLRPARLPPGSSTPSPCRRVRSRAASDHTCPAAAALEQKRMRRTNLRSSGRGPGHPPEAQPMSWRPRGPRSQPRHSTRHVRRRRPAPDPCLPEAMASTARAGRRDP